LSSKIYQCVGFAAVVAIVSIVAQPVHAALYAFAVQQTSAYSVTGGTLGALSVNSSSSAAQGGIPSGSDAHAATFDALQSYIGPALTAPPQNTYTPKGQVNPDYTRGDALVDSPVLGTHNVAETFLTHPGNNSSSGAWSVTAPLTVTSSGAVSTSFAYTNQLTVTHTSAPGDTVQASYSYNLTIQNSSGTVVFSSAPTAVNGSLALIAPGALSAPGAGTVTVTSGVLPTGSYIFTITGTETVFANIVPEPASCLLIAGALISFASRRRQR